MHLGGKRIQGASIKTWLTEEAVPPLDNPLEVLKSGDLDTVVRSLIPFVIFKVSQYKALTNYDTDELLSEGMLGLIEGLTDLSKMTDFMLHMSVHIEKRLVNCSRRSYRRNEELRSDFSIEIEDRSCTAFELRELYYKVVIDPLERQILNLLLEGYSQADIRRHLGFNKMKVSRLANAVYNRIRNAVP